MEALFQALIDGILVGGVYGVIAVGLSLVFGVLGIVNFAQAEFMMLGMYVAWILWFLFGIDPVIGAAGALVVGLGAGFGVQRLLVHHVMRAPHVAQIFLTVGLLAMMENGALMVFGPEFRSVQTVYQNDALRIGPLFLSAPYVIAFLAAVMVSALLWLVLTRTWLGRAIRATSQNPMAAQAFGIDTKMIYGLAFGIGTALTAFGGAIVLTYSPVHPTIGAQYVVLMFTVVVLGGLGSVLGALVGGILVGIIQSTATLVLPIQMQNLALFAVFILVLSLRPQGLLGRVAR